MTTESSTNTCAYQLANQPLNLILTLTARNSEHSTKRNRMPYFLSRNSYETMLQRMYQLRLLLSHCRVTAWRDSGEDRVYNKVKLLRLTLLWDTAELKIDSIENN